ncbi:ABC transporter ATP-binding protein [Spiroplasma endosymbiont of Crioceris asparagi]|uniref:ABC transporter ATP-binding protein n=1 Tax=Spiroplasma endosymbiont of Crioceris asparagi TaxID=3066286 RepID=UPI0030D362F6
MIEVKNITKKFTPTSGNFNISFNVKKGEIYGILGPNGSGKTTLIRQFLGFINSDAGEIIVNGIQIKKKGFEKVLRDIAYVPAETSTFDNLLAKQYLKIVAELNGNVKKRYVDQLIKYFELDVNTKISKMSRGMKQKTFIIAALMQESKILILDEPSSGLDPVMQKKFVNIVKKHNSLYGTTIILCSHIFEEVANLCNRAGFLKHGKLIKETFVTEGNNKEISNEFDKLFEDEVSHV